MPEAAVHGPILDGADEHLLESVVGYSSVDGARARAWLAERECCQLSTVWRRVGYHTRVYHDDRHWHDSLRLLPDLLSLHIYIDEPLARIATDPVQDNPSSMERGIVQSWAHSAPSLHKVVLAYVVPFTTYPHFPTMQVSLWLYDADWFRRNVQYFRNERDLLHYLSSQEAE